MSRKRHRSKNKYIQKMTHDGLVQKITADSDKSAGPFQAADPSHSDTPFNNVGTPSKNDSAEKSVVFTPKCNQVNPLHRQSQKSAGVKEQSGKFRRKQ